MGGRDRLAAAQPPGQRAGAISRRRHRMHVERCIRLACVGGSARSFARRLRGFLIHRPLRSNRHVAALLSALWPGLGQLAIGARRTAVLLALPPLVLVVLGIGAIASPDRVARLASLVNPDVIAALLGVEVVVLVWRLLAVGDA